MQDIVSRIIEYEAGEMKNNESLIFFSDLRKTGILNSLQGCYHRTFEGFVNAGLMNYAGDINYKRCAELGIEICPNQCN